ncbi:MAG: site-specific integrase [Acidobacteriota bacterium]
MANEHLGRVYARPETKTALDPKTHKKTRVPVPKGRTYWYLAYRDHTGKLIRRRSENARTKLEALAELHDVETDIRRGVLRYPKKVKFGAFADQYLKIKGTEVEAGKIEASSLDRIKRSVDWLLVYFADSMLHSITPADIEDYRTARLRGKLELPKVPGRRRTDHGAVVPRTVNRELAQMKNLFNEAEKRGVFTGKNPVCRVDFAPEPRRVPPPIGVYQFQQIIQVAHPRLRQLIVVAAHTLKRKTEVLTLRWENVNWEEGRIYIPKTKSGEANWVSMNDELRAVLSEIQSESPKTKDGSLRSPWVFWSPLSADRRLRGFTGWMADLKAKLREVSTPEDYKRYYERLWFHNLRHFAASLLEKNGVDILTLSKLLGHKSTRTTEIYLHGVDEDQRRATARLGQLLGTGTNGAHQDGTSGANN